MRPLTNPGDTQSCESSPDAGSITSVSFGGDNLDVMYLTSMGNTDFLGPEGVRLFGDAAKPQPHGGGIFAVSGVGIRGIPEPRFAG